MAKERDVNAPGGGHDLRNYWVRGKGAAKIGWGTDGSFARCVAHLSSKVSRPQGLCAEYHKAATGEWPAEKGVESAVDGEEFRYVSPEERSRLAEEGNAMPDGSYPIANVGDLHNAIQAIGRAGNRAGVMALIRKRAKELKATGAIPDSWSLEDEVLTAAAKSCPPGHHKMADGSCMVDEKMQEYADEPWEGVLVVEGTESGDSRMFGLGSLDWAELPMPLQYQPSNTGGHNGSITVGEITHVARKSNELYGWGNVFGTALNGEHGDGIRNTMKVGGVSVDVDDVKDAEVEQIFADSEGGANPFAKPEMTVFHRGRVRGATLVAFPAFVEAKLKFTGALAASAAPTEDCGCTGSTVLTASSHTITIPNLPPAHWFTEPTDVVSYGALTITDEGRVFGVVAPADTTHRNVKTKVPRSLDFSRFHKGETIVEGGERVVTGVITASCGHAPTENYGTLDNRLQHYDNSCSVLANVRVGYARDGGIWVAGALNAGAAADQVAQALGCTLSLDVQPHPDRPGVREFIAAHLVPVPGFPLARTKASVLYNDGVLSAAAVPVDFTDQPITASVDTTCDLVKSLKLSLAESIGRDPATRKRELMESLGR